MEALALAEAEAEAEALHFAEEMKKMRIMKMRPPQLKRMK